MSAHFSGRGSLPFLLCEGLRVLRVGVLLRDRIPFERLVRLCVVTVEEDLLWENVRSCRFFLAPLRGYFTAMSQDELLREREAVQCPRLALLRGRLIAGSQEEAPLRKRKVVHRLHLPLL